MILNHPDMPPLTARKPLAADSLKDGSKIKYMGNSTLPLPLIMGWSPPLVLAQTVHLPKLLKLVPCPAWLGNI